MAREQITVAVRLIDALDARSEPLTRELRAHGRRQPGCRALMAHYGIGALTAITILAELGDALRLSSSRHAVRYAGPDITVYRLDQRRAPGRLSRHGPPALRWALYEAHSSPAAPAAPTTPTMQQAAVPLGGNRVCLAVARKLLKRSYHTLRELGDQALQPAWRPNQVRAQSSITPMRRGRLPACCCRHAKRVAGPERSSGRNGYPSGITPSTITSPTGSMAESRTEIGLGARPHHNPVRDRSRAPPPPQLRSPTQRCRALTREPDTDKQQ